MYVGQLEEMDMLRSWLRLVETFTGLPTLEIHNKYRTCISVASQPEDTEFQR